MVLITEEQVETILTNALQQSQRNNQLVSYTKKIDPISPLHFFNQTKKLGKSRSFWASSDRELVLVAVGNLVNITPTESRFSKTKKQWEQLLNQFIIHNPYSVSGTGVVAIGGMCFDPKKPKTPLWQHYNDSDMAIPELLLTANSGQCYLTVNLKITKDTLLEELIAQIKQWEEMLVHSDPEETLEPLTIEKKIEKEADYWKKSVVKATEEIRKGTAEKIVLAREMRLQFNRNVAIGNIIENLLETQPNSYVFAFEKGQDCFLGATPERLVKVEKDLLLSTCLAGTAPRGKTEEEDRNIAYHLLHDEKNLQEHDFVVQMIREAISDYCFDVDIPDGPVIYPLKNLQHLYTPVTAKLKRGYSIFDIVRELHPTPALGGSPKEASMAFIREYERMDRGWYGAPIGWVDSNEHGEFAVAIRSALIQQKEASLFAGCGVVEHSNPDMEYEETNIKFMPMLHVFEQGKGE